MKFGVFRFTLARAGATLGGTLVRGLLPLAAGLVLGALFVEIMDPMPRDKVRVVHPAIIEPAAGHPVHPAR
jgi:hypothetical protein